MANILRGMLEGMAAGESANAARAAAEEKRRKEEAEWQLKLAGESRLLQQAAEKDWQDMETASTSDKWDSSMAAGLLDRAARFDKTYGKVWQGKSAFKYFGEQLHLAPQKVSGAQPAGVQGPPSPDTEKAHPLMGYRSKDQLYAADEADQKERTRQVASDLQNEAWSFVKRTAMSNGMPDPYRAPLALLEWQAQVMASDDYDPKMVMDVMDNLRDQLGGVFETMKNASTDREDIEKEFTDLSVKASQWVNQQFAAETSLDGTVTKFIEGTQKIRNEMDSYMQGLIRTHGLDAAKILTAQKYIDPESGEWSTGGQADPLSQAYSQAPPWFTLKVEQAFATDPNTGAARAQPGRHVPVYVPDTGEAGIIDRYTNQWVELWQQGAPQAAESTVLTPKATAAAPPPPAPQAQPPQVGRSGMATVGDSANAIDENLIYKPKVTDSGNKTSEFQRKLEADAAAMRKNREGRKGVR